MSRLGMTVPVAGETMAELPAVLDELAGLSEVRPSEARGAGAE